MRYKINGTHRTKTFPSWDNATSYKKKVEGNELAGLVIDPKGASACSVCMPTNGSNIGS